MSRAWSSETGSPIAHPCPWLRTYAATASLRVCSGARDPPSCRRSRKHANRAELPGDERSSICLHRFRRRASRRAGVVFEARQSLLPIQVTYWLEAHLYLGHEKECNPSDVRVITSMNVHDRTARLARLLLTGLLLLACCAANAFGQT